MDCDRCGAGIESDDAIEHLGQTLCEDCYMDAMNPAKACDPWAVRLATGEKAEDRPMELTDVQRAIMSELDKDAYILRGDLAGRLGLEEKQLQRELATLRHMELIKGAKLEDGVYITKF
ncbi:MAG: hypothetical protein JXR96_01320 [Deltaproteobacteria bacterium]|nr:hypothetical protein [Deltaproteobacteria bacterium]